ncbi:MAG TPA: TlpA disulfide reductase family protein [Burkholderiales bacterium]|nr:TlpA disulfide reductase family protein [Burkholderiales bacterium]
MAILRPAFLCLMLAWALLAPHAAQALGVNDKASLPDASLVDGQMLRAADLQGKVVLVAFWATWCPVCVREMPDLEKLHQTYAARGFAIVAVSLDDSVKEVKDYLRTAGLSFPVTMASDAWRGSFGAIRGTPTLFLIDRHGTVRGKYVGRLTGRQYAEIRALAEAP